MKTLIKFYASWCQPCKAISNVLNEVDTSSYLVIEVDIDQDTKLSKNHNVRSLPTLIIMDEDGVEIKRTTGTKTKEQLERFLEL